MHFLLEIKGMAAMLCLYVAVVFCHFRATVDTLKI